MIPDSIKISNDLSSELGRFFFDRKYSKVAVLVDENTERHCLPAINDLIPEHWLIQIKSGEVNKNLETCERIWGALTEASFDRHGLLINLGGGVIGDMGGFCAATYKRGIDFINLPTTLLSQVDASVGGKLGIDFNELKNHIGLFKEPEMVLIAPPFLKTLPKAELRSGFAEVLKHCLIADKDHWKDVVSNRWDDQDWEAVIQHSVGIKASIVAEDPTEKGKRKLLNFGHTIGHAIETTFLNSEKHLLHGEAIAIGMICEAWLSFKKLELPKEQLNDVEGKLFEIFGKMDLGKAHYQRIAELCTQDKKNQGNVINCTLLKSIGDGVINIPISIGEVLDSLFYYDQLNE
ncbi:MAG: 3-dehydroquinate synthase [Cyclobacteriaceae bacterium]